VVIRGEISIQQFQLNGNALREQSWFSLDDIEKVKIENL